MTYHYKNITILNKTSLTKGELHKIIDFTRPDEIKHTAFNLLIVYQDNYRKTIRELGLEKPYKLRRIYPISGCCTTNWKKVNKRWVYRPIVIITIERNFYPMNIKGNIEKGYLPYTVDTPAEDVIKVMTHEFMHIVHNKNPVGWEAYDEKTYDRLIESSCDRYALAKLIEWRQNLRRILKRGNHSMFMILLKSGIRDCMTSIGNVWRMKK